MDDHHGQHEAMRSRPWPLGPWRHRLSPEQFDVALYAGSALFALLASFKSTIPLYRQWGQLAVGPYLLGTGLAAILAVRARRRSVTPLRWWLAGLVLIGAVVVPLGFEVAWRFGSSDQSLHVQPEVVVIERAAAAATSGHDPYQAIVVDGRLYGGIAGLPAYEAFFPYLPAMAAFGLPAASGIDHRATDARIAFLLVTLLAAAMALWLARASSEQRLRALQTLVVLPWAALTLATGGDDLPVIALLMVAMVLAQRRRPGWSGVLLGVASAMKFTAWPLAVLALFAAVDSSGRRRPLRMLGAMVATAIPLSLWALLAGPKRFVANVVLFPLGLAGVESPAGSALPGHVIVTALPSLHRIFPIMAALIGAVVLAAFLRRRPPTDAIGASRLAGWVMLIAILLAPATRVGYLMYPLNMMVWSWMLTEEERAEELAPADQAPAEA